ncbi:hypothetical protein [Ornithinimicrobium kibberense]
MNDIQRASRGRPTLGSHLVTAFSSAVVSPWPTGSTTSDVAAPADSN